MKEKYDARSVIAKLTELLEGSPARRLSQATPMANLGGNAQPSRSKASCSTRSPQTAGSRPSTRWRRGSSAPVLPLLAEEPALPMEKGNDGVYVGVYWSRTLSAAVAVGLARAIARRRTRRRCRPA